MIAPAHLTPEIEDACSQWQHLARAEGDAIRARDWAALDACQKALAQLQPHLTEASRRARERCATLGSERAAVESRCQAYARSFLELARQNAALLEEARLATQTRLSQSRQAARALGRLRASYAPPAPAAWTSFS